MHASLLINTQELNDTVKALFADDKGILAIDESNPNCNKHFATRRIPQTESSRRDWRELIISTPGLAQCISGVILYDETIRQSTRAGKAFTQTLYDAGILIGIKVDTGDYPMNTHPNETITDGADGLRERLNEYFLMGAHFAKWRAAFHIGPELPSQDCIEANCLALVNYANLCQEVGLVPIIETEILMSGQHTINQCYSTTEQVLKNLFKQLEHHNVDLDNLILQPNMILSGLSAKPQAYEQEICEATLKSLTDNVPARVGGIVFLSGGQSPEFASARLNALILRAQKSFMPWPIGFSFARALQQPALAIWNGDARNRVAAQKSLFLRARCDRAARRGKYTAAMEAFE